MEIIENESDSLLLQILSANFEMKHFFFPEPCGGLYMYVYFVSLGRIKAEWRPRGCVCIPQQNHYLDEVKNK